MMLMRYLLIIISHRLMTEKCLNALNAFQTMSVTLTYQTIWLITILWTWKISKNNRTQTKYADQYTHKQISTIDDILCYIKPGDPQNNWKIALPKSLLQLTIKWFHQVTGHPGRKRLFMQISTQ